MQIPPQEIEASWAYKDKENETKWWAWIPLEPKIPLSFSFTNENWINF